MINVYLVFIAEGKNARRLMVLLAPENFDLRLFCLKCIQRRWKISTYQKGASVRRTTSTAGRINDAWKTVRNVTVTTTAWTWIKVTVAATRRSVRVTRMSSCVRRTGRVYCKDTAVTNRRTVPG